MSADWLMWSAVVPGPSVKRQARVIRTGIGDRGDRIVEVLDRMISFMFHDEFAFFRDLPAGIA